LGIGLVAPNVIGALGKMGMFPGKTQNRTIHNSRHRLVKAGLLVYEEKYVRLTPKGEMRLRQLERKNYQLPKPKRWDRKWRVLIFDIPEKKKQLRDKVRLTLHSIGFKQLQKSVWVFPYDCEDFITLLKADFKIGKEIIYLIVETLENDKGLKEYFNLLKE